MFRKRFIFASCIKIIFTVGLVFWILLTPMFFIQAHVTITESEEGFIDYVKKQHKFIIFVDETTELIADAELYKEYREYVENTNNFVKILFNFLFVVSLISFPLVKYREIKELVYNIKNDDEDIEKMVFYNMKNNYIRFYINTGSISWRAEYLYFFFKHFNLFMSEADQLEYYAGAQ